MNRCFICKGCFEKQKGYYCEPCSEEIRSISGACTQAAEENERLEAIVVTALEERERLEDLKCKRDALKSRVDSLRRRVAQEKEKRERSSDKLHEMQEVVHGQSVQGCSEQLEASVHQLREVRDGPIQATMATLEEDKTAIKEHVRSLLLYVTKQDLIQKLVTLLAPNLDRRVIAGIAIPASEKLLELPPADCRIVMDVLVKIIVPLARYLEIRLPYRIVRDKSNNSQFQWEIHDHTPLLTQKGFVLLAENVRKLCSSQGILIRQQFQLHILSNLRRLITFRDPEGNVGAAREPPFTKIVILPKQAELDIDQFFPI